MLVRRVPGAATLVLAVVVASPLAAQEAAKAPSSQQEGQPAIRDGLIARILYLMPPGYAEALHLRPEQCQAVAKLEDEFKQKRRAMLLQTALKVKAIIDSLQAEGEGREPAPVLAIAHEITGGLLETRRTRSALEKQMVALLDEKQREEFQELKDTRRERRREAGERGEHATAEVFSSDLCRRLNLTDEQKHKLQRFSQQWRSEFRGLLTAEQQRQFDQWMARHRPAEATPAATSTRE